jgi:TolB-like protein/cytochrome c-type biogenesis protein CcmH/NrfG
VRIGLHEGDILVQPNGDGLGDGVNIASRLQTLAEPDTICISQKVYEEVEKKLSLGTAVSLGRPKLKNIAQRFGVYFLLPEQPKGLRQALQVQRLKLSHRVRPSVLVLVSALLLGGLGLFWFPLLSPFRPPPAPSVGGQSEIHNQEALPLPDKPSIVVLPFDNMSGDSQQDYFSNGITEVLTSDLSRIASLFVIARNTAFTYKGKAVNVQDVGRELGVRYGLEGSVQKANEQVRIVAQLIDTTTGSHIWSERYDRPLKDIFALQDEIVQKIVTTLKLQLSVQEQGVLARKRTDNLEAYDYCLRGVDYSYRFTKESNAQARPLFEKTIALDPQYAEAYAWLGMTYMNVWIQQWSPDRQTLQRALELEQQALALDVALPRAHILLSYIYVFKTQYEPAVTAAERAIALNPSQGMIYVGLANSLNFLGRSEEALGLVEKAVRLTPRLPTNSFFALGQVYYLTGRTEEAIAVLKKSLNGSPADLGAHLYLAAVYSEVGRDREAQAAAAEVLRINPKWSLEVWKQRVPYKEPAMLERVFTALRKAGLK